MTASARSSSVTEPRGHRACGCRLPASSRRRTASASGTCPGSPFFRLVAENERVFAALPPRLHRALVREYIAGATATTTDESPSNEDSSRLSEEWIAALSALWCTDAGQAAFYRQIAALRPEHTAPIVDRLGEVRCPVRIGWGEDDPWIPVDQTDRLAEALPGNPHVTRFPHSGHLVPLEAPHDLLADVTAWLDV